MEAKQQGRERGILKLEPRSRGAGDARSELTPQASWERPPVSPQPSVDRLSVTWAEPEGSMTSSVNLFHLPSETPLSNEVTFSPSAGAGSEDEDYSASLSAVLRQRRASVRRSRKGRGRRPSSPFLVDELRGAGPRRRSSVFTTSSGDTAISMEDQSPPAAVTQEQIFENIHLNKEVLGSVKLQTLDIRRKMKIVHMAKTYIKRHQGQLQERLAQSKSTRDIYARFNILINTKWQQMKREAANMSNLLIPWELRIKEIESHFGSVVASYFTFLRWLFWVNLVIGSILMLFVIVPEYLTANAMQDGERKIIMEDERRNATNLLTLWEFEGLLKCSPIFYGYYTNVVRPEYRMPLAYFLTGLVVYIYSFVATLRKMAENSRMSKLSEKEDECIFSWKLFTGWDYMIGNTETAQNRIASVILGFKEALLEEAEKKKDLRNWRIISRRILVNICIVFLLILSAFVVVTVVSRSDENAKGHNWWSENETTVVVTCISITFPLIFEGLGIFEHYHPRKQLRLQLGRIMFLNLLNLYSLIFALFSKIEGMTAELDKLKPPLNVNTTYGTFFDITEAFTLPSVCKEVEVPCGPEDVILTFTLPTTSTEKITFKATVLTPFFTSSNNPLDIAKKTNKIETILSKEYLKAQNLLEYSEDRKATTRYIEEMSIQEQLKKLDEIRKQLNFENSEEEIDESDDDEYSFDTEDITESTPSLDAKVSTDNTETHSPEFSSSLNSETTESSSAYSTEYMYTDYNNSATETSDYDTLHTDPYSPITESDITDSFRFTSVTHNPTTQNFVDDITTNSYITDDYTRSDTTLDVDTLTKMRDIFNGLVTTPDIYSYWYNNYLNKSISSISTSCPYISFNCTAQCNGNNVTQVFTITNCTIVKRLCYMTRCEFETGIYDRFRGNQTNETIVDVAYFDEHQRKMYNLTTATKKKLSKLCWETMFGQELVKLTMMDLIFVLLATLFWEFFRALFVRYCTRCWCWNLEKRFPQYGDFKIAENILHLINNQGMVWMGMFFSPGLAVLNVVKLVIMMYLRSWAVMTCNVPHEVVFRVSKSNNFYLALLLTMLFLCVLPVGYSIVWVKPSWHCGPFSEYEKIYHILTSKINLLPKYLKSALECIASPAIVIPLLVLLILIIYYLASLTKSLREANNDLKIQLRRERTEERRKMFQLADKRGRKESSIVDNTPYGRWKKALPTLTKSIDSDERKATPREDNQETKKTAKKGGGIFAKIVNIALDRKGDVEAVSEINNGGSSLNNDEETDTDFHETLPRDVLKIKDIVIANTPEPKKIVDIRTLFQVKDEIEKEKSNLKVQNDNDEKTDIKAVLEKVRTSKFKSDKNITPEIRPVPKTREKSESDESEETVKKLVRKQTSESSNQSKQSESISSVIPVITISTTDSDEELLQAKKRKERTSEKKEEASNKSEIDAELPRVRKKGSSEARSLRRQSSVDSVNEHKTPNKKPAEGPKDLYCSFSCKR